MPTEAFAHTRIALHHALQVASALSATLRPGDDVHEAANLGWDPQLDALVGRRVGPRLDVAAGLRLRDATWLVVRDGEVVEERKVVGSTLDRARSWLQGVAAYLGCEDRELIPPGYELPPHVAQEGQPLADLDKASLERLHAWYSLASTVLTGLRAQEPRALPVRAWPHHFDLGTLIVLDRESGRGIGIGMAPGDARIPEPYLYVNPYPSPVGAELPPLGRGQWHTEAFFGAVFAPADPSEAELSAFVGEAVAHCHTLLDDAQ
ncbi:MAG: hypothetical protein AAF211_15410 [Myxococcota bacterium]